MKYTLYSNDFILNNVRKKIYCIVLNGTKFRLHFTKIHQIDEDLLWDTYQIDSPLWKSKILLGVVEEASADSIEELKYKVPWLFI